MDVLGIVEVEEERRKVRKVRKVGLSKKTSEVKSRCRSMRSSAGQ